MITENASRTHYGLVTAAVHNNSNLACTVNDQIRRSWRRCLNDHDLDPDQNLEPIIVEHSDLRERKEKQAEIEGQKKKIEWGSQIRNYVLHPYKMVKDIRTNFETGNVNDVLDGNLNDFIKEYLMQTGGE